MNVQLMVEKRRHNVDKPPVELYEMEMTPEEFAGKVVDVVLNHPDILDLSTGSRKFIDAPVFAFILGKDPARFKEGSDFYKDHCFSYQPSFTETQYVSFGKLVQVSIGYSNDDTHYFYRIKGKEAKYIPYSDKCGVTTTDTGKYAFLPGFGVKPDDPIWPWIAFYPEKFSGLTKFDEILLPDDKNPLTGLIGAKDAPIRTLAKQIASKLQSARNQWAQDIIATL